MQSTHQYEPHTLSRRFIDQFNQEKNQLKRVYCDALIDIQGLQYSYPKTFDPFYRAAWYDDINQVKQLTKKFVAEVIVQVAAEFEESASDTNLFLAEIDKLKNILTAAIADNRAQDPAFFFDSWRNKPPGGALGAQLDTLKVTVDALSQKKEAFVNNYMALCKNRLNYLYTALALLKEKSILLQQTDYGVVSSGNVPFQTHKEYHFQRNLLEKLNNTIDDPALVDFVTKKIIKFDFVLIDGAYCRVEELGKEYKDRLEALENQCLAMIHDVNLAFFEIFVARCMSESMANGKESDRAELLLKRFLLTDFIYQLPFKEKEYWWRLIVQAHHVGRGKHIQEITVAKQYNFYARDDFWDMLIERYTSNPTMYAGSPTIDVLRNSSLVFQFTRDDIDEPTVLQKEFTEAVQDTDIPLNKMLAKKADNSWKQIHGNESNSGYPRCNWKNAILEEFNKLVIEPMKCIHAMTLDPERVDESSYLGQLFLRASAYTNAAAPAALQNEKKVLVSY